MKLSMPNAISSRSAMAVLKIRKNSPTILFGSGIVLGLATVVTACRATLQVEEVLNETQRDLDDVNSLMHSSTITEREVQKSKSYIYLRSSAKLTKLYAPSIALGIGSVACLTQSHRILTSRNAGLAAAYAAVDKAFDEYRGRVVEEYGEDKDREFRYGSETRTIVEEDSKGPKKKQVKSFGDGSRSMYARIFDEYNKNWNASPEYNVAFLRLQQNWANDRLRARGHLFLNELYEELGLEHTPAGAQVGWLYGRGTGDDFVDLGIWDDKSMQAFHNFVTGAERGILLDFNVDGVIWDKI